MDVRALGRQNLEQRLAPLREMDVTRPSRGWLRAMRDALGMTTRQLAARLGKNQSAIVQMERSEERETISLSTLREAAEAMDCQLVYAIVPKMPIDQILRARAEKIVDEQLARVGHTMALENQSLDNRAHNDLRERMINELLKGSVTRLWDKP